MAAPYVTGAIALVLSMTRKIGPTNVPNANQLLQVLKQKTADYDDRWDPGQGFGVIDVKRLLAAFARRTA